MDCTEGACVVVLCGGVMRWGEERMEVVWWGVRAWTDGWVCVGMYRRQKYIRWLEMCLWLRTAIHTTTRAIRAMPTHPPFIPTNLSPPPPLQPPPPRAFHPPYREHSPGADYIPER